MTGKFNVYQIYFKSEQRPLLDTAFIPFDNSGSPLPDEHEYYVFRTQFERGKISTDSHTGYLSWKFTSKTGITGNQFVEFCQNHPGYDAYFIDPFPMEIFLGNIWEQGDARHPGLLTMTQSVFERADVKIDLRTIPRSLRTNAFCNYWVGNKRFWDAYMAFTLPIYHSLKQDLPEPLRRNLAKNADPFRKASYFAFIFERLFSTFIATHPEFRVLNYEYSIQQLMEKYSREGAVIIDELQKLERAYPEDHQPLDRSPLLQASLSLFYLASERSFTPFGRSVYSVSRQLAQYIPRKGGLLRNPLVRRLAQRYLNSIRPESASLTLPPGSL